MPDFLENERDEPVEGETPLEATYTAGLKTFLLDPEAEHSVKSKDALKVRYAPGQSVGHFAAAWSSVYAYDVWNVNKAHGYTVFFFRARIGFISGQCNCVARKICKHIIRAWEVHESAVEAGFVPAFPPMEENENE